MCHKKENNMKIEVIIPIDIQHIVLCFLVCRIYFCGRDSTRSLSPSLSLSLSLFRWPSLSFLRVQKLGKSVCNASCKPKIPQNPMWVQRGVWLMKTLAYIHKHTHRHWHVHRVPRVHEADCEKTDKTCKANETREGEGRREGKGRGGTSLCRID